MNKKLLIGIIVIVLLLVGGGYYVFSQRAAKPTTPGTSSQNQTSGPKTLKDLLGLGTAQKCTFASEDASGKSEGTVYVASGKVRTDVTTTANNQTQNMHMIVDGNTSYTWVEGQKTGFKMTINTAEETTGAPVATANPEAVDVNKPTDYKCEGWTANPTLFALPAGVTFTDMSALVAPTPGSSSGNAAQCAACESLSGDAKTQCLTALKCQ